jgi:hypothetical protein
MADDTAESGQFNRSLVGGRNQPFGYCDIKGVLLQIDCALRITRRRIVLDQDASPAATFR